MKARRRHSDWHKNVPSVLTEKPPVWRGPGPASREEWKPFQEARDKFRLEGHERLAKHFKIRYAYGTPEYWHQLANFLLDLFPRFQTVRETRGSKKGRVVEPESAMRRARRDRRAARA